MTIKAVDASTRGRSSRVKGRTAEQKVAKYVRPWYPDACRAVRNTDPDPGDIDCTSPGLFWSVKDQAQEKLAPWLAELDRKAGARLGLLVVHRAGYADPARWWCWLRLCDLLALGLSPAIAWGSAPSRDAYACVELRHLMPLLVVANYAVAPGGDANKILPPGQPLTREREESAPTSRSGAGNDGLGAA